MHRRPTSSAVEPRLVLITDPRYSLAWTIDVVNAVASVLKPFALAVQLRDKVSTDERVAEAARVLRETTRRTRAIFLVNGRIDLARAVGADGVHMPAGVPIAGAREALGQAAFITTAAHNDDDVVRACGHGADAVFVSPIFTTPGKGTPRGTDALSRAVQIASQVASKGASPRARVYALGGVTANVAASCAEAGADGVAVIRALLDAASAYAAADVARTLANPFTC
ncbi:MAG: thiamine phosphate synthase [Polyangiaceae bacterium]|nr:thiamine phosphate synthase [Polyangiaceae bacterium]